MELKITEEKENALVNRKEIKGHIKSEISPSRAEISRLLSEKFSLPIENVRIKEIRGKFGTKIFNIKANIYSSKKDKDEIELKKKKETRLSVAELKETGAENKISQVKNAYDAN